MEINFWENSVQSGGTGIGEVNEYNIYSSSWMQELAELKRKTAKNPKLAPAVTELESAVKSQNKSNISGTIQKYAAEFSTTAFANLASAGILEFIKSFMR